MPVIVVTWEAEIKRIMVQSQPRQIVQRPYLKNTQHKMGWQNGSSGRAPAYKGEAEFNHQYHKKKKNFQLFYHPYFKCSIVTLC
jgi:hypothetical protein